MIRPCGLAGRGYIWMMSVLAMAPQPEQVSGGGGETDHHAPRTPITLPPHREHVPTRCIVMLLPAKLADRGG